MRVSTMRIPTCDAARRTGECERGLWCPTSPPYDADLMLDQRNSVEPATARYGDKAARVPSTA